MELSIRDIAKVVGATNNWQEWADIRVSAVEFDTRKIEGGALFVPLQGGTRDGHEFIQTAVNKGAVLAFWSESIKELPEDFPVLVVPDTLVAFQQLAKYYLGTIGPKVIGVTGSNGKTTTKDMIASVLSQQFVTYKTQGNYNNHIGLPYTILHMPAYTEMLILEMGMDHFGEIEVLSQLATPDVAAITMIGESHIEFLGSRQGIAQAKMEIVAGLKPEGLLVVPGDEPLLESLLESVTAEVIKFGRVETSDISGQLVSETKATTTFTVPSLGEEAVTIPVLGHYNINNALIALTIGDYFGMGLAKMARGLESMNLTASRTEWLTAWNGAEILSDVYNANPTAMSLVLDTFSQLPTEGNRLVVLADMGELGEQSAALHKSMAKHIDGAKISSVYLLGQQMAVLYETLLPIFGPERVLHFKVEDKPELINRLKGEVQPADMLLLKGSNSMKLIEIVENLLEN
ncbi:UDP-N-acetylmuramoyl-tripeptide--D-alanyl-D-alanine ligase [uncultured Vagococcus sp.]|uniref:UDP-N-acetylmuramoyl-tripeptide--D-alanyl-D- alanine ligase n=1 Tax=uncultured Vagococcus sp. TaxID=189676 RepID=UPI0028D4191C|nr:UDP-N-acetylmuramoyl-tripeptide--D-alanyl-D-alanine ligase [uncultured Vagococcus sp.]